MKRYLVTIILLASSLSSLIAAESELNCILYNATRQTIAESKIRELKSDQLLLDFTDGSSVEFQIEKHPGFSLYTLQKMDIKSSAAGITLFDLNAPKQAKLLPTLNGYFHDNRFRSVMSASPELIPVNYESRARASDKPGCEHRFTQTTASYEGKYAAEFASYCKNVDSGWSMRGMNFRHPVNCEKLGGLRAWIYGDGNGQSLKFQPVDTQGGVRDYYIPIDFKGWRNIEVYHPALDYHKTDELAGINIYYNGVPANRDAVCRIDQLEGLVVQNGTTITRTLENFEDPGIPDWQGASRTFSLDMNLKYAGIGSAFALVECDKTDYLTTLESFQQKARIPFTQFHGTPNKKSEAVHESYLFLTAFSASQFDEAMKIVRKGGFRHVLIEQHSWCESTGHYQVNKSNFPGGLNELVNTFARFRKEGISVGLHLLAASIDNNDPYITPIPDPRLFTDATTKLSEGIDATTSTIEVEEMPQSFPEKDGGYMGDGTVLRIGDELITYTSRTLTKPYRFLECKRGHLGTSSSIHQKSEPVRHLARSYGYHYYDADTSLLDEVTSNFAVLANACNPDMLYFDGMERLQGSHFRYNARLINAFLSKLNNRNILVQASSYSHFSWNQLSRAASADGHGDLKGYLEERSPIFEAYGNIGMPLDVGWYYGYDTNATLDQFEYILGSTIGYNASFSFQVSVDAARKHPYMDAILELIRRYEILRLKDGFSTGIQESLRVPKGLQGFAPEVPNRPTELRKDFRLYSQDGTDFWQQIQFGEWHTITGTSATQSRFSAKVAPGAMIEFQVHNQSPEGTEVISNPGFEIAGSDEARWQFKGDLAPGEYLDFYSDRGVVRSSQVEDRKTTQNIPRSIAPDAGIIQVQFTTDFPTTGTFRARVNQLLPMKMKTTQ